MSNIRPSIGSTVRVHYTGWTTDGKMFDTTTGSEPLTFPLQRGGLIDGWIEGLQLMVVGEKRRFWIPGDLAYDKIRIVRAPPATRKACSCSTSSC